MKRILSLLLVLAMLLSGCGGGTEKETAKPAPETVSAPEATEAPITEPTLSPEEVLYNSLPDRMKQAVDVGIVELLQLEDLDRIVTVGEASEILQKAYVHRIGEESKTLAELMTSVDYSGRNATRGWLAAIPGLVDMELCSGEKFESYDQWVGYLQENFLHTAALWWSFPTRFGSQSAGYHMRLNMEDEEQGCELMRGDPLYCPMAEVYAYSFNAFDATNGKKVMTPDEEGNFNPLRELTLAEITESALCFYNYPNPMDLPEFIAPEEMGSYNSEIITQELLNKETDLPEASCQKLPSEWHGVVMDDMDWLGSYTHLDGNVYEYEIKAVKEAGFNFIAFNLDFNNLQEYYLFDEADVYADYVDMQDKGKLSIRRLEQLDQILAWCMKYDIHLNLRCTGVGGFFESHPQNMAMISGTGKAKDLAKLWKAIAVRYMDIPNKYLSFTVLANPVFNNSNAVLSPSIEAIQEVSPERCLMVEVGNATNKKMEDLVKLGVALSYRVGEPYAVLSHKAYYRYNKKEWKNEFTAQEFVDGFSWPYEGFDGEKVVNTGLWGSASIQKTIETAEEYGLGFMVGEFGIHLGNPGSDREWPTSRYPDESYKAMITDVLSAVESRGYGWCFAKWYGYFGITCGWPAYENVSYQQLEDYPYYIDTAMLGWFKEINGVA